MLKKQAKRKTSTTAAEEEEEKKSTAIIIRKDPKLDTFYFSSATKIRFGCCVSNNNNIY